MPVTKLSRRARLFEALEEIARVARDDDFLRKRLIEIASAAAEPTNAQPKRKGRPTVWTLQRSLGFLATYYTLQRSGYYTERAEVLAKLGEIYKVTDPRTVEKRITRCMRDVASADPVVEETVRSSSTAIRMRPKRRSRGT